MLFQYILLSSFKKIEKERSVANIYHLLTGRRSIQTIQDAQLYQLQHYYGIYRPLLKTEFDIFINKLSDKGFLAVNDELMCTTSQAKDWLQKNKILEKEIFFKGHLYSSFYETFYARLLLMIQVWTNSKRKERSYLPVIEDYKVEQWVKHYYYKTRNDLNNYLTKTYRELTQILETVSNRQAHLFVDRLTGYKTFGLSIAQLANHYKLHSHDVYLHIISVVHQLIYLVKKNHQQFPILYFFIQDLLENKRLSQSAQITNEWLKRGLSVEQIATKRKLTKNTIYDHIVEIALHDDDFPYERFVTKEAIDLVTTVVHDIKSYRLKEIKQHVPEQLTYFQIRLILTRLNRIK